MLVRVLFDGQPRFNFFSEAESCVHAAKDGEERSLYTDHSLRPVGYVVFDDGLPEPVCFSADLDSVPYAQLEPFDVQDEDYE